MSKQNQIAMPGVFGGLMRYDEEYQSRFMISPMQVIFLIVAIIVFVLLLKILFPIQTPVAATAPAWIIPLLLKQKL
jgi:preprotein translocase subunit Sec61beta